MPLDLSLPPKLWLPPKPAIIRALSREELVLASFLPGMFPGAAAAAGGAALTTLTQVGSGEAAGDTGSVTVSVTIQAGDLLVVGCDLDNVSGATLAFPATFTSAAITIDTSTDKSGLFYKIATGSEGTTVVGGTATGGLGSAFNVALVFRGDIPITSVALGSAAAQATDGNPTAQVVTASGGTPPLVVLGFYSNNGGAAIDPRTMTPAKDGEVVHSDFLYVAYKIYNSSPADVSVDMDDEGTGNRLGSCYLACS